MIPNEKNSLDRMRKLMNIQEAVQLDEVLDAYTGHEVKRAYVSIRIRPETFAELNNGVMKGVEGVSTSKYNVSEWFVHRDCLVMMPFDKFMEMNNTEQIEYGNLDKMMANNMDVFFRLYDRKSRESRDHEHVKRSVGEKILHEMTYLMRQYSGVDRIISVNLYDICQYLNPSVTGKFYDWLSGQEISSVRQFAERIVEFWPLYTYKQYPDHLKVTPDTILEAVHDGIAHAASIYMDESEWLLRDKTLHIPKGSQLIFKRGYTEKEVGGFEKWIAYYHLDYKYKIGFTKDKDLSKYQADKWNKKSQSYKDKYEQEKSAVEQKHVNVINEVWLKVVQKIWEGVEKAFKEWEEDFEYYYDDPEGDLRRVDEPYIYNPKFKHRFDEAMKVAKTAWDTYWAHFTDLENLHEYSFSGVYYDMDKVLDEYCREHEQDVEEDLATRDYRNVECYRFYRMIRWAVDKDLKYEWMTAEYKQLMGRDLYRVYGTSKIKI